jgi:hypothetical protein
MIMRRHHRRGRRQAAAALTDDWSFVRRVYVDLIEDSDRRAAEAFVNDTRPNKGPADR